MDASDSVGTDKDQIEYCGKRTYSVEYREDVTNQVTWATISEDDASANMYKITLSPTSVADELVQTHDVRLRIHPPTEYVGSQDEVTKDF